MFSMTKKNTDVSFPLPVPYLYPEQVEDKIMMFNSIIGNYPIQTKEDDLKELLECIPIAEEKGLEKQANFLKRRAIAGFLELRGMALINSERTYRDNTYAMSRFGSDGKVKYIHPTEKAEEYKITELKSFNESLPIEVIRGIPKEMVDNVKVLYRRIDPIAYIPITLERDGKWWGIAIYHW